MQTVYGIKAHGGKLVNLEDFSEAAAKFNHQ
ncbi:hypothetical protein DmLsi_23770 [Lactiplantibacillus plantarum]|nr:hypothetical protein DmLsi_23770 [Lactiplantibacillus plantarum]